MCLPQLHKFENCAVVLYYRFAGFAIHAAMRLSFLSTVVPTCSCSAIPGLLYSVCGSAAMCTYVILHIACGQSVGQAVDLSAVGMYCWCTWNVSRVVQLCTCACCRA